MLSWLGIPFRFLIDLLRGISELFEWLLMSLGGSSGRPWWQTLLLLPILIPYWLGRTLFAVIAYPFSLSQLEPERRLNFYYGIPAVLAMLFTVGSVIYSFVATQSIDNRYRASMQRSIATGDYKTATILGGRLISNRNNIDAPTRFEFAIALARNGENTRAEAILSDLAPTDRPGYGPAHLLKAQATAADVARSSNAKILGQLRWHLENCDEEDAEEVLRLWAVYFIKVGQPDRAAKYLERAAVTNPRLDLSLANLYKEMGSQQAEYRSLRNAEQNLRRLLTENPLALSDRVQLAIALIRLERSDEAEELVLKGVELHNDLESRRAAAQFYVLQFDITRAEKPEDLARQFQCLQKAFQQDLGLQSVYERLIVLYQQASQGEEAKLIRQKLETLLVEGKSTALVHFALSSLARIDGDDAKALFHLKQANRQNDKIPVVANNLAWMLANDANPDLAQAMEFSQTAVSLAPHDVTFRDTMATILMKQEKYQEALAAFEAILDASQNKREIHAKLATIYQKLGETAMAAKHAIKAEEANRSPKSN